MDGEHGESRWYVVYGGIVDIGRGIVYIQIACCAFNTTLVVCTF